MNENCLKDFPEIDVRMMFIKAVGNEISRLRKLRVMSGKELAVQLNVSQQQISRYECGICNITVDTLILILNVLDFSIDDFFKNVYLTLFDIEKELGERYQSVFLSLDKKSDIYLPF